MRKNSGRQEQIRQGLMPMPLCKCDPKALAIEELEEWIGEDAEDWEGRCYEIATMAAELVDGTPVYGHYTGYVDKDGFWSKSASMPFQRHGWVKLSDGRVLDPTRWSFEGKEPYIYIGSGEDYDEGGNEFRSLIDTPRLDASDKRVKLALEGDALLMVLSLLGADQTIEEGDGIVVNTTQAAWLANLPYDVLSPYQAEIYDAISSAGQGGHIRFDNWERARRESGGRK